MTEEILSIRQVAALLQLSDRTVYRLANDGDIPGFRIGRSWRFRRSRIDEWMDQQLDQASSKPQGGTKRKPKRRHQPPGGSAS